MNSNWTLCPLCLEKVDDDGNGEPWNHTCRPQKSAMIDPVETRAPERIWAWTWDLLGYGRKHGAREWVSFLPKPFSVKRFVPTGKRWWQFLKGEEREVFQVVTEYIRADLVADLVVEQNKSLTDGIREAIRLAEQPHYGDTVTALDHYGEAVEVLRSLLKKQSG